jgi:hypothetical protein
MRHRKGFYARSGNNPKLFLMIELGAQAADLNFLESSGGRRRKDGSHHKGAGVAAS